MTSVPAERAERIEALGYDYSKQATEPVASCNLCAAEAFVVIAHRDRYGYRAQAHACGRCGLVFLNPRMTAAGYARFYDGVYRPLVSAFHGRLIDARTIQAEQQEYAAERAEFLRPFLANRGLQTMLDIGGSTGVVAKHLVGAFDLRGTVVDPAPLEVEQAKAFGLEAVTGLVEQYDFRGRRFDVVIICQTVDHLLDARGTLARVRELVSERGWLYIDIVDFRAAYLRHWSVEDAIKIDHPYYLTEATMTAYLQRAGFEVVRSHYAADHLHVGYLCRPGRGVDALPDAATTAGMFREIRYVQNASRR